MPDSVAQRQDGGDKGAIGGSAYVGYVILFSTVLFMGTERAYVLAVDADAPAQCAECGVGVVAAAACRRGVFMSGRDDKEDLRKRKEPAYPASISSETMS